MYKIIINYNIEMVEGKEGIMFPVSSSKLVSENVKTQGLKSVSGETIEECIKKFKECMSNFEDKNG